MDAILKIERIDGIERDLLNRPDHWVVFGAYSVKNQNSSVRIYYPASMSIYVKVGNHEVEIKPSFWQARRLRRAIKPILRQYKIEMKPKAQAVIDEIRS